MADIKQLEAALIKADAAGNAEDARTLAAEIRRMRSSVQEVKAAPESSMMDEIKQGAGNLAAGMVRGAGSIGATLLAPKDIISDALDGKGFSLESNRQRRADMDSALESMGAQPDSMVYKGGKLTGEIAGTMGAGGLLANGLTKIPVIASKAPALVNAIRTAGMSTGTATAPGIPGTAGNLLTRMAGGAVTGGVSAGLVDPESAGAGAAIGAAAPPLLLGAGKAANAIGRLVSGPEVSNSVRAGVKAARDVGYVVPPSQAKPTLGNRLLEGMSGKITTAQNASARNQQVTNGLAAEALGLPKDTQITADMLNNLRKQAGQAYEAVSSTGTITPDPSYAAALDKITAPAKQAAQGFPNAKPNALIAEIESLKSGQFDASSAVSKIGQLREQADVAYRSGDKGLGKALKDGAAVLEDVIDQHLQKIGAPGDLLNGFRQARQQIAKTYTVENALNATSGTVNAQKLAAQLAKGKPLSGELRQAAEFARQFPKAAQPLEKMGSLPQLSPLDWAASGAVSAATSNPLMLASVLARPAARTLALSPIVQNRLAQQGGGNALSNLLSNPELQQLVYRASPLAANR